MIQFPGGRGRGCCRATPMLRAPAYTRAHLGTAAWLPARALVLRPNVSPRQTRPVRVRIAAAPYVCLGGERLRLRVSAPDGRWYCGRRRPVRLPMRGTCPLSRQRARRALVLRPPRPPRTSA